MGAVGEYTPGGHVSYLFLSVMSLLHVCTYIMAGCLVHILDSSIPVYYVVVTAYVSNVLALMTHWMGHRRIVMWWHTAHMGHHINDYPPTRFLSDGYKELK
eukprot:TRINITY_DN14099_c0_g1_i1.p1 TRINITY_DN14099_c0_g1~~TRINITY_DN14099_c0_g1_i1.p1  ORF type:complete len:101 (+),score=12.47 TRINITY_DN14099_c0_g1_i1:105-407(+)